MNINNKNVVIQGYPGSFHDMAAQKFWPDEKIRLVPANSFDLLAQYLRSEQADIAVMAIENSIAGTILQNYRILRENEFWVSGEIYLRIQHQLLGIKGSQLEDIKEVASHPMAINQCRQFLEQNPDWKLLESEDTALSAEQVFQKQKKSKACIASVEAARLYHLDILAPDIETNKTNYTRFFVVNKAKTQVSPDVNKASVYIRVPDEKGHLLKVLEVIHHHDLNMSKLQSFPVLGSFREYFFHLDIEFDHLEQYLGLKENLLNLTFEYEEIGLYKRADIQNIIENHQKISV